jgi:hypothetical protein
MHTYGIVITFVIARDKNIFHRLCGQTLQAAKGDGPVKLNMEMVEEKQTISLSVLLHDYPAGMVCCERTVRSTELHDRAAYGRTPRADLSRRKIRGAGSLNSL